MDASRAPGLPVAGFFSRRRKFTRLLPERLARRRSTGRHSFEQPGKSTWEWNLRTGTLTASHDARSASPETGPFQGTFEEFAGSVHPGDRQHFRDTLKHAAAEGTTFTFEFRLLPTDGRVRWRYATGDAVRNRKGRVTHLIGIGLDITTRKEAEEKLRQTERHYRTLVEQLPLASYVEPLDHESATYISPQISDLVGYPAEEWISRPDFFGSVLHPEDRDRVLAGFATMHASGHSFECDYRVIARDGHEVWVHDAAVIVHDEDGARSYAQGYMIDISDRKRAELALDASQERLHKHSAEMEHLALHDALTGLPNRTLFHDRIEHEVANATRDHTRFALLLIDLDRFKEVNDTLGHYTGDMLLREVAARLRKAVRGGDTVARLGGDEFALLTPRLSSPDAALALADKLRVALLEPIILGGLTFEVEASVGIALYPDHGEDVETLTRHADVSMYVSKNTHSPIVYADEYDQDSLARLELVSDLRRALNRGQLTVYFQPQSNVASGKVLTVEALVRWQHPQRGLLGPDEFIPLAEQTGLIRSLTQYVMDAALRQCDSWRSDGRRVAVAVNITARELVDLDFPEEVRSLLAKWNVEPALLELEITETTIMTDLPRARTVLTQLASLGVRLAVDDFGSGRSSFSYLRHFPIDVLKIDKSYIQNMLENTEDDALVRSAIDLAHNLGLEVVAEGVETEAARRHLQDLGCDTLQGYHIGFPSVASGLWPLGTPQLPLRAVA